MIPSHYRDYGLVLFHLSQVWVDGKQLSPGQTRARVETGAEVTFYDQTLSGPQYGGLSREKILHQALVVWRGVRPRHLMRNMDQLGEEYMQELAKHREMFMVYVNGGVFIPCELVRVKGVVVGYITERIGIIECQDKDKTRVNVFFQVDDVLIFKEPLGKWEQRFHCAPGRLLPLGLHVSVDARKISGMENIQYQAILVLAGSWPTFLPSALPGGPGSFSEAYDVPDNMTFYYLELSLEAKLVSKLERLKVCLKMSRVRNLNVSTEPDQTQTPDFKIYFLQAELERTQGEMVFTRRNTNEIRDSEDRDCWRQQFTDKPKRPRGRGQERREYNRDVKTLFRAPPVRIFKTKRELDDSSSVATGGESVGGLSGVSSSMSRPESRLSRTSSCWSTKSRRDWFNPHNWRHGGLRYILSL